MDFNSEKEKPLSGTDKWMMEVFEEQKTARFTFPGRRVIETKMEENSLFVISILFNQEKKYLETFGTDGNVFRYDARLFEYISCSLFLKLREITFLLFIEDKNVRNMILEGSFFLHNGKLIEMGFQLEPNDYNREWIGIELWDKNTAETLDGIDIEKIWAGSKKKEEELVETEKDFPKDLKNEVLKAVSLIFTPF